MAAQLDDVPLLTVLASLPPGFPAAVFPTRAHWQAQLEHDPQLSLPVWSNNAYELLFPQQSVTDDDPITRSSPRFIRSILSPDSAETWSTCLRNIATPDFALHSHPNEPSIPNSSQAVVLRLAAGGSLHLSVQLVESRWIIIMGAVTPEITVSEDFREGSIGTSMVSRTDIKPDYLPSSPVCLSYLSLSMHPGRSQINIARRNHLSVSLPFAAIEHCYWTHAHRI